MDYPGAPNIDNIRINDLKFNKTDDERTRRSDLVRTLNDDDDDAFNGSLKGFRRVTDDEFPVLFRYRREIKDAKVGVKIPFTFILSPPASRRKTNPVSRNEPYILADLSRGTLVFVMFDWSEFRIPRQPLQEVGFDVSVIAGALSRHARSSADGKSVRKWEVRDQNEVLSLSTIPRTDRHRQLIGRFSCGENTWFRADSHSRDHGTGPIEVLILPRLTEVDTPEELPPRYRSDFLVPLARQGSDLTEPEAIISSSRGSDLLRRTFLNSGTPKELLAMLKLAKDVDFQIDDHQVETAYESTPSAIMWLPITRTLEKAAQSQRRQYRRKEKMARAPTGTLDVGKYIQQMAAGRDDRVPVRRHELTHDTPENRLLRGMARKLASELGTNTDRLSRHLTKRLRNVEGNFWRAEDEPPSSGLLRRAQQSGRRPDAIQHAVAMSEALLHDRYPGLEIVGNDFTEMDTFQLSISALFEEAVRRAIDTAIGPDTRVLDGAHEQDHSPTGDQLKTSHSMSWSRHNGFGGAGTPHLKPDLVFERSSQCTVVGDVKYKQSRMPRATTFAPLNRHDFYQICGYMLAWPTVKRGVMVLPETGVARSNEDNTKDNRATTKLAELTVDQSGGFVRKIGIFSFAPSRWGLKTDREPLLEFLP